jgi:hypothetical protein
MMPIGDNIINLIDPRRINQKASIKKIGYGNMGFLKHGVNLLGEMFGFAKKRKAWWIIPLVITFLLVGLLIAAGESVTPFIYTLF